MVPGVGVEPLGGLILRNLLILRNDKMEKNCKNAGVRYTAVHGPPIVWRGVCTRYSGTRTRVGESAISIVRTN
jgi:hypothetical protein